LQSLLGSINWVRPNLGITTDDLQPLFSLLKGNSDLNSPRSLTAEAKQSLALVHQKISSPTVTRKWDNLPPVVFLFRGKTQPFSALGQYDQHNKAVNIW
ncbi:POK18 protein, partial [Xiphorhynchus elegans]|nr:POK18 protein [Xiphorhynchus elegans]